LNPNELLNEYLKVLLSFALIGVSDNKEELIADINGIKEEAARALALSGYDLEELGVGKNRTTGAVGVSNSSGKRPTFNAEA